jgi:putative endonuclease
LSGRDYSLYIVRCGDGTLYTGIAIDVRRRLESHERGARGAKYLRGRGPLRLEFARPVGDRAAASRAEVRVKRLGRSAKEALIAGRVSLDDVLAASGSRAQVAAGASG